MIDCSQIVYEICCLCFFILKKNYGFWNIIMFHSHYHFLFFEQDQIGLLQSRPLPPLHQSQRLLPRARLWVSLRSFCSRWRRPCRWESRPCRCQSSWTPPWSRPRPPCPCCLGPSPPVPPRTEEPPPPRASDLWPLVPGSVTASPTLTRWTTRSCRRSLN